MGWTVKNSAWLEKDNLLMKKVYENGIAKWGILKDKAIVFTARESKDCLKFIKENYNGN